MTLVLLALDALDAALVERFDLDAYRLDDYGPMETVAHMRDQPYTPEAWATAATGVHPTEHRVSGAGTSEWENPLLNLASVFTGRLPEGMRGKLGQLVERTTGDSPTIGRTDAETLFDRPHAVVRNWPGVTDGADLQRAWDLMVAMGDSIGPAEFERELFGLCAEQFAWVREMLNHDVALAGVHIHTLDAAGHAYSDDEESLRRVYERVAEFVVALRDALGPDDDLVILSDHGMTVSFYSDADDIDSPGNHSWRAYSSVTTGQRPESIDGLTKWIDDNISTVEGSETDTHSIPEEQLRQLGYID